MKRSRSSLPIEQLESRLFMAGNITGTLVGEDLVISGDEMGNSLTLETTSSGAWALSGRISAQPVDTTINGQNTSDAPVLMTPPTGNLIVQLAGGNDRFDIFVFDGPLRIRKAFSLDMGSGDDTAILIGISSSSVGSEFLIDLGEGNDYLSAGGFGIGTDIVIQGRGGNDSIGISRSASRDLAVHAGEGYDAVRVEYSQIRNSTLIDGGTEGDRVELAFIDFANDSAVFGREGG